MSVTTIEWTQRPGTIGETWNPTTGCNKVDRGCKFCYAEIMHKRLRAMGQAKYAGAFLDGQGVPTVRFSHEKKIFTFTNPGQNMIKVGKHKSGHELDGQIIQQFPQS